MEELLLESIFLANFLISCIWLWFNLIPKNLANCLVPDVTLSPGFNFLFSFSDSFQLFILFSKKEFISSTCSSLRVLQKLTIWGVKKLLESWNNSSPLSNIFFTSSVEILLPVNWEISTIKFLYLGSYEFLFHSWYCFVVYLTYAFWSGENSAYLKK